MFVSVTRLRVRRFVYLLPFLWKTRQTQVQVQRASGLLGGKLLVDRHRAYWTLTVWESEKAMKAFRGVGAHGGVMPRLAHWCDEAAYGHWESAEAGVPSWEDAYAYLLKNGKQSRVQHPSAAHEARLFPAPRLKPLIGSDLKPKPR